MNGQKVKIMEVIKSGGTVSFSAVFESISDVSERTLSRYLSELVLLGYLKTEGGGRSLVYSITTKGRLFLPIDTDAYNTVDVDIRTGVCEKYVFSLWEDWPDTLFSETETIELEEETKKYRNKSKNQSEDSHSRELERFVIEMSWKSSRIEGNTYTLLDTELLLKEGIPSKVNTKEETQMILNHKKAFEFIQENKKVFGDGLTLSLIEAVQCILMEGFTREKGLRTGRVGITGSRYQPLDNKGQIEEGMQKFIKKIHTTQDIFTKALTVLVGISYIQPFIDGNKRTARLITNGILMAEGYAPLSYRDVDERTYRASLLVFYEQLSIIPMKELFSSQYLFSTEYYTAW